MSDLHVDACAMTIVPPADGFDVILLLGDVADGWRESLAWIAANLQDLGRPILYVPGNHDFYAGDLMDGDAMRQRADELGITLLDAGQVVVIDGVRFVGATLWTDYAISGDVAGARFWAKQSMPDIKCIDVGMRRVHTKDLMEMHRRHADAIEEVLRAGFDGPTVVLTHHAPSARSLDNASPEASDASFASDLTRLMLDYAPDFWFHGHVHRYRYYEVGSTQVLCNPRGYQSRVEGHEHDEHDGFDPTLIVEV